MYNYKTSCFSKTKNVNLKLNLISFEIEMFGKLEGEIIIINTKPIYLNELILKLNCYENFSNLNEEKNNEIIFLNKNICKKTKILNCGIHTFPFIINLNKFKFIAPTFDSFIKCYYNKELILREFNCFYKLNYFISYKENESYFLDSKTNIKIIQNLKFEKEKYFEYEIFSYSRFYEINNLFKSKIIKIGIELNKLIFRTGDFINIKVTNEQLLNIVDIQFIKYIFNHQNGKIDYNKDKKILDYIIKRDIKRKLMNFSIRIPETSTSNILTDIFSIIYFLEFKIKLMNSNNWVSFRMGLNILNYEYLINNKNNSINEYDNFIGEDNYYSTFYY